MQAPASGVLPPVSPVLPSGQTPPSLRPAQALTVGSSRKKLLLGILSVIVLILALVIVYFAAIHPQKKSTKSSSSAADAESGAVEKYNQVVSLGNQATAYYTDALKANGEETAVQQTLAWLRQQKTVNSVAAGAGCIWYRLDSGVECVIETDPMP